MYYFNSDRSCKNDTRCKILVDTSTMQNTSTTQQFVSKFNIYRKLDISHVRVRTFGVSNKILYKIIQ